MTDTPPVKPEVVARVELANRLNIYMNARWEGDKGKWRHCMNARALRRSKGTFDDPETTTRAERRRQRREFEKGYG